MKQTPINENHNTEVFSHIPANSSLVIEVGSGSGALARAFKHKYPDTHWIGVEIDADYAQLASRYCDETIVADLDLCSEDFYLKYADRKCWVFADVLEHLKDPWSVLKKIRAVIPEDGCIVACIPNAQHWSVIARLVLGEFRYEDSGLLDRTHLRWFTRQTIQELFESHGFRIEAGCTRILDGQIDQKVLELLGRLGAKFGKKPEQIISDVIPFQYVVRAVPV